MAKNDFVLVTLANGATEKAMVCEVHTPSEAAELKAFGVSVLVEYSKGGKEWVAARSCVVVPG